MPGMMSGEDYDPPYDAEPLRPLGEPCDAACGRIATVRDGEHCVCAPCKRETDDILDAY